MKPLMTMVDLDMDKPVKVTLSDQRIVTVTLLDIETRRDSVMNAIREARVWLRIDDQTVGLPVANYHLPQRVGPVQADCMVVRSYYEGECGGTRGASSGDSWYLKKDARIRLWPADSPWIRPGTFSPPLKRPPFASDTFFCNEPVSTRTGGKIYYHIPLDFGGAEGYEEVFAATDGTVVVVGETVLEGDHPSLISGRYDRVFIRDERGWYYRYDHLLVAHDEISVGQKIRQGQRIGRLGKEGTSGGWAHLHFEIQTLMPSGVYGFHDAYAYFWQSYLETEKPRLLAVARPRCMGAVGESIRLDGTRSWPAPRIAEYRWFFTDGNEATGPVVRHTYQRPGIYSETLMITDCDGNVAYDFATVSIGENRPSVECEQEPEDCFPMHKWFFPAWTYSAARYPARDVMVGDEVTFLVRVRATNQLKPVEGEDVWNFGDGSPEVKVRSNVDPAKHAANGYAETKHRFDRPGDYLVSVRRETAENHPIVNRLHVRVRDGKSAAAKAGGTA